MAAQAGYCIGSTVKMDSTLAVGGVLNFGPKEVGEAGKKTRVAAVGDTDTAVVDVEEEDLQEPDFSEEPHNVAAESSYQTDNLADKKTHHPNSANTELILLVIEEAQAGSDSGEEAEPQKQTAEVVGMADTTP